MSFESPPPPLPAALVVPAAPARKHRMSKRKCCKRDILAGKELGLFATKTWQNTVYHVLLQQCGHDAGRAHLAALAQHETTIDGFMQKVAAEGSRNDHMGLPPFTVTNLRVLLDPPYQVCLLFHPASFTKYPSLMRTTLRDDRPLKTATNGYPDDGDATFYTALGASLPLDATPRELGMVPGAEPFLVYVVIDEADKAGYAARFPTEL